MNTQYQSTARDEDFGMFSDCYKSVYGFRPRGHEFYEASDERRKEIWKDLYKDLERVEEEEKQADKEALEEFENLVSKNIELGAESREQAIQWIVDGLNLGDYRFDEGYICYNLRLPYSCKSYFKNIK